VAAVLQAGAEPLSGYPVQALLQACCDAPDPEQQLRAWRLLDVVIGRWIERLDEDIRSAKAGDPATLQGVEQRIRDTSEALRRLQLAIQPLTLAVTTGSR
jgi:hypothetical protein